MNKKLYIVLIFLIAGIFIRRCVIYVSKLPRCFAPREFLALTKNLRVPNLSQGKRAEDILEYYKGSDGIKGSDKAREEEFIKIEQWLKELPYRRDKWNMVSMCIDLMQQQIGEGSDSSVNPLIKEIKKEMKNYDRTVEELEKYINKGPYSPEAVNVMISSLAVKGARLIGSIVSNISKLKALYMNMDDYDIQGDLDELRILLDKNKNKKILDKDL